MIAFSTETTSARDSSAVTGCQYSAHVKSTNACMPQAIHNKYTCLNSLHISGLWFDFQFFFSISIFKQMLGT